MRRHALRNLLLIATVIGALATGCGGGGESAAPSGSISALGWDPPASYADNTALDPFQDLEYYEIYVSQDGNFTDNDLPVALIKAVTEDPTAGGSGMKLETEFVLENLSPFIATGRIYYISLKAIGVDGQKSAFMSPVPWDQRHILPL